MSSETNTGSDDAHAESVIEAPTMYYCWSRLGDLDGRLEGEHIMHSAGSAWKNPGDGFTGYVPENPAGLILDSGGFQVVEDWGLRYPYTVSAYFSYAEAIGADEVALPDFACEPDLHESSVRTRQRLTLARHAEAKGIYDRGEYSFDLLPVMQGWDPEDYVWYAQQLRDFGFDTSRMAIGTVCKRTDTEALSRVLTTCCKEFPETSWHLFGLTLNGWKDTRLWGRFDTSDTAAWNWGEQNKEHGKELWDEYHEKVSRLQDRIEGQSTFGGTFA